MSRAAAPPGSEAEAGYIITAEGIELRADDFGTLTPADVRHCLGDDDS